MAQIPFNVVKTVIAVFPGRFQPFSKHHNAAFKWLQSKFGPTATYIATSDVVKPPKSPLNFEDKKQIITKYGFADKLVQVKNPYKAEEITSQYDPKTTAIVFMVGDKDMKEDPRFAMKTKKDGTEGYFKPYKGNENNLKGYDKHGYLVVAPHQSFDIPGIGEMSGTNVRLALSAPTTDEQYKKNFIGIFGWYDEKIAKMLKEKFKDNTLKESKILFNLVKTLLQEGGAGDNVICEICGAKVKAIAPRHLKCKHNITLVEYKELYPNAKTIAENLKIEFSKNNPFKNKNVKDKIRETKLEKYGNENYNNSKGWKLDSISRKEIMNRDYVKNAISEGVKKSYENNPLLREIRSKTIGEIGKNNFIKIKNEKYSSGEWISSADKDGFFGYRDRVRLLTKESYNNNFYNITDAKKRSKSWHLDHKYSILEGYKNDVPEELISHWTNLEILHHSINESKGYKSSITLKELINSIKESEVNTKMLLLCGGAGGHMAHPFDIDSVNTGLDLAKVFVKTAMFLKKNDAPVKIDGVNASIRLADIDGKKKFVMDRGSNKPLDVKGVTKADLKDRFFVGHGMVKVGGTVLDIFNKSFRKIKNELAQLGMLDNPNILFNIEYVEGTTNVQDYGKNFLAIHGLLEIKQAKLTKRVTSEISYSKEVLEELIKNLQPVANKYGFEVLSTIPAKMAKQPNFQSELSKSYTINIDGKDKQTKSLQDWLKEVKTIPKSDKIKLADGKVVGALSKQVFMGIKSGKTLSEFIADQKDYKKAIDGFVTYMATMQLGDALLKSLDSRLGPVDQQEGVVIRDTSISPEPFKITGSFIVRGLESSF
jgi:hypothetical protein